MLITASDDWYTPCAITLHHTSQYAITRTLNDWSVNSWNSIVGWSRFSHSTFLNLLSWLWQT